MKEIYSTIPPVSASIVILMSETKTTAVRPSAVVVMLGQERIVCLAQGKTVYH